MERSPVAEQLAPPSANFALLGSNRRRLMVTVADGRRQGAGRGGMDASEKANKRSGTKCVLFMTKLLQCPS